MTAACELMIGSLALILLCRLAGEAFVLLLR